MISERIRKAREHSGLKLKQAAKLLNTHYRRLEKMEAGEFDPTSRELEKMASAYEVTVPYLERGVINTMMDDMVEHYGAPEPVMLDIYRKWGAHVDLID